MQTILLKAPLKIIKEDKYLISERDKSKFMEGLKNLILTQYIENKRAGEKTGETYLASVCKCMAKQRLKVIKRRNIAKSYKGLGVVKSQDRPRRVRRYINYLKCIINLYSLLIT